MSETIKKRPRIKQFILTFTPFFILTLLFIGFNFWPGWLNQFNQQTVAEVDSVGVKKEVREPVLVDEKPVETETAVLPTPTETAQPIPTPQPTLPPDAKILLIGPPQESVFPNTSTITFYWNWPLAIVENQQFALTIISGEQEQQIATINEQNLGTQYALTVDSGTIQTNEPESLLFWRVYLMNNESGTILAQSEQRAFSLLPQATQR